MTSKMFENWRKEVEERNKNLKPGLFAEACNGDKYDNGSSEENERK